MSCPAQKRRNEEGIAVNDRRARFRIGRGRPLAGDKDKVLAAYQDFLTLWKDADPDIPILIAAKAEYAKLK